MNIVWTRAAWNSLLHDVNNLLASPPSSLCPPVAQIPLVGPSHIWTKNDIRVVQNRLLQICPSNTFPTPLILWKQGLITDITNAITRGWCIACQTTLYGVHIEYNVTYHDPDYGPFDFTYDTGAQFCLASDASAWLAYDLTVIESSYGAGVVVITSSYIYSGPSLATQCTTYRGGVLGTLNLPL